MFVVSSGSDSSTSGDRSTSDEEYQDEPFDPFGQEPTNDADHSFNSKQRYTLDQYQEREQKSLDLSTMYSLNDVEELWKDPDFREEERRRDQRWLQIQRRMLKYLFFKKHPQYVKILTDVMTHMRTNGPDPEPDLETAPAVQDTVKEEHSSELDLEGFLFGAAFDRTSKELKLLREKAAKYNKSGASPEEEEQACLLMETISKLDPWALGPHRAGTSEDPKEDSLRTAMMLYLKKMLKQVRKKPYCELAVDIVRFLIGVLKDTTPKPLGAFSYRSLKAVTRLFVETFQDENESSLYKDGNDQLKVDTEETEPEENVENTENENHDKNNTEYRRDAHYFLGKDNLTIEGELQLVPSLYRDDAECKEAFKKIIKDFYPSMFKKRLLRSHISAAEFSLYLDKVCPGTAKKPNK